MADIEERADKWARDRVAELTGKYQVIKLDDLFDAYIAGVAQTQKDYTA